MSIMPPKEGEGVAGFPSCSQIRTAYLVELDDELLGRDDGVVGRTNILLVADGTSGDFGGTRAGQRQHGDHDACETHSHLLMEQTWLSRESKLRVNDLYSLSLSLSLSPV